MRRNSVKQKAGPAGTGRSADISYDTLERFVGYHMKRAFNVVRADLSQALKPFDLRMLTYTALVLVVDNPGLSQTRLAAAMDIERANLVVIIDELERRGLIVRERVPADRRVYALSATTAGHRLCEKAVAADVAREARLFADVDKQTRDILVEVLSAVGRGRGLDD